MTCASAGFAAVKTSDAKIAPRIAKRLMVISPYARTLACPTKTNVPKGLPITFDRERRFNIQLTPQCPCPDATTPRK
jgi:hypothetical protein